MKHAKKGKPASKSKRNALNKAYDKAVETSKPGAGKRFSSLTEKMKGDGYSAKSAKAIAASIGRKKYGAKGMATMAAKGKKSK